MCDDREEALKRVIQDEAERANTPERKTNYFLQLSEQGPSKMGSNLMLSFERMLS